MMPKVIIDNKEIYADSGKSLLDIALDNDIELDHNCGGNCACSTCHVYVIEGMDNLSKITEEEEDMLDTAEGLKLESRLACQTRVRGNVKIALPPRPQL
ncbi:MAG: 2Fe-2S iron-sulfur cluster-binding protein [Candidatus Zixiibacteriota bacterium]